jgi:hypothetical protein
LTYHLAALPQAYGIVWRSVNKKDRSVVAIKKIFDAFQNATDAQVCAGVLVLLTSEIDNDLRNLFWQLLRRQSTSRMVSQAVCKFKGFSDACSASF